MQAWVRFRSFLHAAGQVPLRHFKCVTVTYICLTTMIG